MQSDSESSQRLKYKRPPLVVDIKCFRFDDINCPVYANFIPFLTVMKA